MNATSVEAQVALALPACVDILNTLLSDQSSPLTDAEVMRAWEADYQLFAHATQLSESIAHQALYITTANSTSRFASEHYSTPAEAGPQALRKSLLESVRNLQFRIRTAINDRVSQSSSPSDLSSPSPPPLSPSPCSPSPSESSESPAVLKSKLSKSNKLKGSQTLSHPLKPRLYRLADRLVLNPAEIRAFVYIILTCTGVDGLSIDERRQSAWKMRAELQLCKSFSGMESHQLLHFLSPSRKHFVQGLLEVDEEFAAMYTENRFRAPREVLKAIYGCTLTLDEAMTFGNSALSAVLSEEPGSIQQAESKNGNGSRENSSTMALASILGNGDTESDDEEEYEPGLGPNGEHDEGSRGQAKGDGELAVFKRKTADQAGARDRTTDNSAVLELLSELHVESETGLKKAKRSQSSKGKNKSSRPGEDIIDDDDTGEADDEIEDEDHESVDAEVYADDMEYLKDGFEVVQESCKVYNFREKNSEEDRYTHTKRPVEALQREADAKLRKASALFMRRLGKTKKASKFIPRLELLVEKLKLAHFERMVILTLVGAVLSQSIRKTMRSDPSLSYDNGITIGKLLRMHCDGDLRKEIQSRSYFYRNAMLIRSGIVSIDVPYNMSYSDLGDFNCELDHLVLDYVAGLHTELEEIMDSARCYTPKIDMDSVILPESMKLLALQRAQNFDTFRRLRKEVGFDDIVRYGKGLTLFFHGKSGTGKTLFANALASHLKKKLLVVDFTSLNSSKHSNADAYRIVFREAKIHGAIVFIDECDELFESRDRGGKGAVTVALREMETFDGIMILATNRPQMLDEAMHRRIALSLMFESPDARLRLAIWEKHIPKNLQLAQDVDLQALAIEFELTGGFIKNAVFQALAHAVNRAQKAHPDRQLTPDDTVITMSELRAACRLQARGDLKRAKLERAVLPECGLDRLVATTKAIETLRDVADLERVRRVISMRYGLSSRPDGRAAARVNCVLILGPSGSGKSFAAACLGYETGRPLQRLSASELHTLARESAASGRVGGSISSGGSSSSHLSDVFAQAAVAGAVLVVEHAEQVLMDTTEACLELLYHIQCFDGLVVLCCTTASETSDHGWPGFLPIPPRVASLLSFVVALNAPNEKDRLKLWKQLIPPDTPLSDDVDSGLPELAKEFNLTGAKIAACIRRAAGSVAMRHNRAILRNSIVEDKLKDCVADDKDNLEPQQDILKAEDKHVVSISDLRQACESEMKLKTDLGGNPIWSTALYV